MNTKPSLDDLLEAVALTLEQTILPALGDGVTRERGALVVNVVRHALATWDRDGASLHAENRDIEKTLGRLVAVLRGTPLAAVGERLEAALAARPYGPGDYPPVRALADWHRRLKDALVETIETMPPPGQRGEGPASAGDREVRALLSRMLAREVALAPGSPGG